jgi:hypothetical protein
VVLALLLILPEIDPSIEAELSASARTAFAEGLSLRDDPVKAKEHFARAVELYEQLHERVYANAELFRSQGNAALLADDVPRAVLAYRRGLRHAPTDAGLQEGLALARAEVARKAEGGLGRPPVEDRPPWLPRVGFSTATLAGCAAVYALGWVMLARSRMMRRAGLLAAGVGALVLSGVGAGLLGLATLYERREQARPLVVVARDELPLRLGNGEAYPSRFAAKLPRGAEAHLLFRRGDWVQIELAGGEVGWVPLAAVLLDAQDGVDSSFTPGL